MSHGNKCFNCGASKPVNCDPLCSYCQKKRDAREKPTPSVPEAKEAPSGGEREKWIAMIGATGKEPYCQREGWDACERIIAAPLRTELSQATDKMNALAGELEQANILQVGTEQRARRAEEEAARWEALANEWMADYDKLKNKYEPMIAVTSAALSPVAEEKKESP